MTNNINTIRSREASFISSSLVRFGHTRSSKLRRNSFVLRAKKSAAEATLYIVYSRLGFGICE
jgi:hypothetical protein